MTQEITKHFSKKDLLMMKLIKMSNSLYFTKFCCFFSLRQGTILIAIIELTLTSFITFLLLLGATHAQDVVALVSSELQQLEEAVGPEGILEDSSIYITSNERRMLTGQHLAFFITVLVCTGLVVSVTHLVSCTLLLYGAVKNSSRLLLPWTSTVLIALFFGSFSLLMIFFIPMNDCKFTAFLVSLCALGLEFYSWLVVYSYYRELKS